jgi:tropomyosin
MNSLRIEADEATAKVEELQKQVKALEHENLQKEQEITSLQHKNGLLEAEVEQLEAEKKDLKASAGDSHQHATQNETLQRRLQLLEEEAEEADKNLRETNDKYVPVPSADPSFIPCCLDSKLTDPSRLRQTDVKAGHYERKVKALEQERDQWETKYEEMAQKYAAVQKELQDFQAEIGNM